MFKYEVGDICMIKNAPEAYDELNGWVVTLQKAGGQRNVFQTSSWKLICLFLKSGCLNLKNW